jgi:hypothetical protein
MWRPRQRGGLHGLGRDPSGDQPLNLQLTPAVFARRQVFRHRLLHRRFELAVGERTQHRRQPFMIGFLMSHDHPPIRSARG